MFYLILHVTFTFPHCMTLTHELLLTESNWFFFLHGTNGASFFLLIFFHQAVSAFEHQISQDEALYKCGMYRSEDRAFGAKPWPKCSAKVF